MEPGRTAVPGCFPRRNRIVAGLSTLLVVVEAGHKSGALNSANWAQQMSRDVAAVPGQIDDPRAAGSNQLIRDGCLVVTDVEDVLTILNLSTSTSHDSFGSVLPGQHSARALTPEDAAILGVLGQRPLLLHDIAFASGMTLRQVGDALLRLEVEGMVESVLGGYLIRSQSLAQAMSEERSS
jgi:DNA processing protein